MEARRDRFESLAEDFQEVCRRAGIQKQLPHEKKSARSDRDYRRYYDESGDSRGAIHRTLDSTGRAMLVTTLALATGFLVFTQASMNNITNFGALTSFAIFMALVADFLLAPALMQVVHGRGPAAD